QALNPWTVERPQVGRGGTTALPGQRLPVAAEFAGGAVVGQGGCPQRRGGALVHRSRSHGLGTWPGGGQAGHTAFTRIGVSASSAARVLVRAFRAALLMP